MLGSLVLLWCWPLANATTPPRWESNIEKRYAFQSFDRPIRATWMKQQGLVFLTPGRLLIYQVNPASARVKLAPRGSTGGAGNFVLILKVLNARDGNVLHSLELTTSGEVSRVFATHSGGFVVQAGAALYAYSPSFEQTAVKSLPAEKKAPYENWQMQVSASGEKLVLLHEQVFIPAELLADNTVIHDGRAEVEIQVLDSASLQPQGSFSLAHTLAFWTPGENFLFSSNPEHSYSDGKLGILDFSGSWSAIRSDLPKEQHFCRYGMTVIDAQRAAFFGCDSFSVFSSSGKAVFSGTGPGCFFSSAAAAGAYIALQCDSYTAERLTQRSLMVSPPRADRLEVYDVASQAHRLSVRARGERVYYALSEQGELAVIDGTRLRIFGVERRESTGSSALGHETAWSHVILSHAPAGQVETGMTKLVWHRHSCRCLLPQDGRFGTGKSACATNPFHSPQLVIRSAEREESRDGLAAAQCLGILHPLKRVQNDKVLSLSGRRIEADPLPRR